MGMVIQLCLELIWMAYLSKKKLVQVTLAKIELNLEGEEVFTMHAYGHDVHMTVLIGVAEYLENKDAGKVALLVLEPAEEVSGGARNMIKDGLLLSF